MQFVLILPTLSSVYGVKGASPFASLAMFNPVTFFPLNVMHDILEGLVGVSEGTVIKSLVRHDKVSLTVINGLLVGFRQKATSLLLFLLILLIKTKQLVVKLSKMGFVQTATTIGWRFDFGKKSKLATVSAL